jgi:toxin ParE1/3/4
VQRVIWTAEAIENLEAVGTYIEAFNPAAAARIVQRLVRLAESLAEFSERGRNVGDGRREMTIVPPYVLRYRVDDDRVLILRIRHGAREPD